MRRALTLSIVLNPAQKLAYNLNGALGIMAVLMKSSCEFDPMIKIFRIFHHRLLQHFHARANEALGKTFLGRLAGGRWW